MFDSHNQLPETRTFLSSPTGKTNTMEKHTISLGSKNTLIDHRNWSRYPTATKTGHPSTGYMKKPLNGNEDASSIPSTVYAGC